MKVPVLDAQRLDRLTRSIPIVKRLVVATELASTQDEARRLAEAGAEPGTVVLAHRQTGGRGSRGRPWFSPAGAGLYLSMILRPAGDPASQPRWTLAASLGVCRAFRSCAVPAEIQWPNDILIRGRKAAGILAEYRGNGAQPALILGIGANLSHTSGDFPPDLAATSTSIRMEGGTVGSREELAASVLDQISSIAVLMYHDGWVQVRRDWIGLAPGILGGAVRIREESAGAAELRGTTAGVDDGGALIVHLDDGSFRTVHSSESLERLED